MAPDVAVVVSKVVMVSIVVVCVVLLSVVSAVVTTVAIVVDVVSELVLIVVGVGCEDVDVTGSEFVVVAPPIVVVVGLAASELVVAVLSEVLAVVSSGVVVETRDVMVAEGESVGLFISYLVDVEEVVPLVAVVLGVVIPVRVLG